MEDSKRRKGGPAQSAAIAAGRGSGRHRRDGVRRRPRHRPPQSDVHRAAFDDAALNVSRSGTFDVLDPPDTATMTGTVEDTTGARQRARRPGSSFPAFSGEAAPGIPVDRQLLGGRPASLGTAESDEREIVTTDPEHVPDATRPGRSVAHLRTTRHRPESFKHRCRDRSFNGDPFTRQREPTRSGTSRNGIVQTSWRCGSLHAGSARTGSCSLASTASSAVPAGLAMAQRDRR